MGIGGPKNKKQVAAAALFFNKEGKVLIVKPNYKDNWLMPGGGVEEGESPIDGCVREIKEELSLEFKRTDLKFFGIDYIHNGVTSSWGDALRFLFFGGVLSDEQIAKIKIQESELEGMEFVDVSELPNKLSKHTARAVMASIETYKKDRIVYLEDGQEVL